MLFKIVKLVRQESKRQNPSSRTTREFYLFVNYKIKSSSFEVFQLLVSS